MFKQESNVCEGSFIKLIIDGVFVGRVSEGCSSTFPQLSYQWKCTGIFDLVVKCWFNLEVPAAILRSEVTTITVRTHSPGTAKLTEHVAER